MGWTGTYTTKAARIKELLAGWGENKVVASRLVGKELWYVVDTPNHDKVIVLSLIEVRGGEVLNKEMDESAHPYYYKCPLSFLAMAPEICPEWRKKVRDYHESVKTRKSLKTGQKVRFPNAYYNGGQYLYTVVKRGSQTLFDGPYGLCRLVGWKSQQMELVHDA